MVSNALFAEGAVWANCEVQDDPAALESLKAQAEMFFESASAKNWPQDVGSAELDKFPQTCRALISEVLALPIDAAWAPGEFMDRQGLPEAMAPLVLNLMPYFCGQLALLNMEFWHETLGQVPHEVIRELLGPTAVTAMAASPTVLFKGVPITGRDVLLYYRRKPIFGKRPDLRRGRRS